LNWAKNNLIAKLNEFGCLQKDKLFVRFFKLRKNKLILLSELPKNNLIHFLNNHRTAEPHEPLNRPDL